jgi:hypothetical protein
MGLRPDAPALRSAGGRPERNVIDRNPALGQEFLNVAYGSEKGKYDPIARRMTPGSNWHHLNRLGIERTSDTRGS